MRSDVATSTTRPDRELGNQLGDLGRRLGTVERNLGDPYTLAPYDNLAALTADWPDAEVGSMALLLDRHQPMLKVTAGWSPTVVTSSVALTTSSVGGATVTFPVPFTAPPMVTCIDADAGSAGTRFFGLVLAQLTAASFAVATFGNDGNVWASKAVRIGYVAVMRP